MLGACSSRVPESSEKTSSISSGKWELAFVHPENDLLIPTRTEISNDSIIFVNGTERIATPIHFISADSIQIKMPVFGTYFNGKIHSQDSISGIWTNPFRNGNYQIPFFAKALYEEPIKPKNSSIDTSVFEVMFSPGTDDEYPAVGIFVNDSQKITGTFLTETGDYRYLEGKEDQDKTWLSCFDGTHLFYFEFDSQKGDSISGKFYSGKHWQEPFVGAINPEATLAHPDSLTKLTTAPDEWSFTVENLSGQDVVFNPQSVTGQVTIVQILGSWCPNCMDETIFFNELYRSHHQKGLNIIPVAFEAGTDTSKWVNALNNYSSSLNLPYQFYIGGSASKNRAGEIFSMLDKISSFPTTIFIDRKGNVRKIHTGFYGPGTGAYFSRYKSSTFNFIEKLLAEDDHLISAGS